MLHKSFGICGGNDGLEPATSASIDGHLAVPIARIRQSGRSMSDCPAQWPSPPATKMSGWVWWDVSKSRHFLIESPNHNAEVLLDSISCRGSLRPYLWQAQCTSPGHGRSWESLREGRHDRPRIVVSRDTAGFRNRSNNSQRLYSRFLQEMETGIT